MTIAPTADPTVPAQQLPPVVGILPTNMARTAGQALLRAGVVFGETVQGFGTVVTLPSGWQMMPTDDNISGFLLVDGKRRTRAIVDDKSASVEVLRQFTLNVDRVYLDVYNTVKVYGMREHHRVFATKPRHFDTPDSSEYWEAYYAAYAEVDAWLNKHWPDWKNPSAYWD